MIVSGQIVDNEMKIIPFANVVVVGENRSTAANQDGFFSIQANGVSSVLRISHAGYDFDEVTVEEFNKFGYYNLFPNTNIDQVDVINNYKKDDNSLIYAIAIFLAVVAVASNLKGKPAVKVKA